MGYVEGGKECSRPPLLRDISEEQEDGDGEDGDGDGDGGGITSLIYAIPAEGSFDRLASFAWQLIITSVSLARVFCSR